MMLKLLGAGAICNFWQLGAERVKISIVKVMFNISSLSFHFYDRFRSITKQYFRKADGVILMYDVTTEATFTNVRNWVTSIKEGVEEGTALVVVGNKTDLIEEQDRRAVKAKDGNKLAAVCSIGLVLGLRSNNYCIVNIFNLVKQLPYSEYF